MSIWFEKIDLDIVNKRGQDTLVSHLDIKFIEIGDDFLKAVMPVNECTRQPMGILHGGASLVLSETMASTAANFCVDNSSHYCVGLEINANHIRSVHAGEVTGLSKPLHLGRSTQIWEVRMFDEKKRMNCISRVTMAVITREK